MRLNVSTVGLVLPLVVNNEVSDLRGKNKNIVPVFKFFRISLYVFIQELSTVFYIGKCHLL